MQICEVNMEENIKIYEQELLDYYTELIKNTYLKDSESLGINARNKINAKYNRLVAEENVAQMNSLVTRIGDTATVTAVSTAAYITTVEKNSPLLNVYAMIKVYVALKFQTSEALVDPLHVISTFDPSIWQHENIQNYANAALEYNKYEAMLTTALTKINNQTKIK